jgi:hypothetical protein
MTDVRPRYQLVGLDCPDPLALADFYSRLTGLEVEPLGDIRPEDVEWIELDNGAHPNIAFQRVPNYVAPTWPDGTRVPTGDHVPRVSRPGGSPLLSGALERLTTKLCNVAAELPS